MDLFNSRDSLKVGNREYAYYRLEALETAGLTDLKRLPYSIRILLQAALRQCNEQEITQQDVKNIASWSPKGARPGIPFLPARAVMQDFTGVPAVVDLAAQEKVQARNVRFSLMDVTKAWDFEASSFDLVICNLVLEHIRDLDPIFSEANRVLKAGGGFFVNELHPFRQYEGTKARFYRAEEKIDVDAFIHHISDFLKAAEKNGLSLSIAGRILAHGRRE